MSLREMMEVGERIDKMVATGACDQATADKLLRVSGVMFHAQTLASGGVQALADFYTVHGGPLPYAQKHYADGPTRSYFCQVFLDTMRQQNLELWSGPDGYFVQPRVMHQ